MPKKKSTASKKKPAKKTVKKAVKKTVKKSPAKPAKKAAKKPTKKSAKKGVKKTVKKASNTSPAKKKAVSKAPAKKASGKKAKAPLKTKVAGTSPKSDADDSKGTPIVFSLDDVEELMASKKSEKKSEKKTPKKTAQKKPTPQPKKVVVEDQPVEQRKLGAASLADILGFNPAEKKKNTDLSSEEVPKKWKKYYKLLIELRGHVRDELNLHTSDTLKHSSRDDSGDLSSYGSHQADAGTDTFDRDFALSLVSNEQEALNEIEEAILRIKNGTYGTCEVTGKAIPAARLTAVPFARFSVDGQAEYEKNMRRKVDRSGNAGLFGDASDAPKLAASDDDE
ncbi:transcriptional regulator [Coraliomargarita sinensis]|uniref:Transcriptional regulator n=1 Tax=Coraliomargarita sinensis TaxID=2174842 RepID=A0A317ZJ75_9BACT|nr:TraR/DksA C4-type zinc finger protein [Coraliomargarita sinensis]PXA03948.1 transcriptional regulator [Coraliomargarita sinensis]